MESLLRSTRASERPFPKSSSNWSNATSTSLVFIVFFADLLSYLETDKFVDDYATIAFEAPKLCKEFIHQSFVHIRQSISQKNAMSGLAKMLEMDEIIYHAVDRAHDNNSIFILSI